MLLQLRLVHVCEHKNSKKKTQNSKNCSRFESLLRAWHPDPAFFILPWVIYIRKSRVPRVIFSEKKYKKFKFSPRVAFTEFQVSIVFWWGAKTHTDTYTSPNMETLMPAPRGFDFIYSCQCMDRFKVWRIYRLWFLNSIIGNLRVTYKSTVEYLRFLIEVKSVFSCFLKFLIPTDAHNDMAS